MRGSVLGSAVVHVGLVAGLISVRHRPSIVIPGPDVVQVALLEPAAPPVTPPPAVKPPEKPRERPAEKAPAVTPTEEQGVKLAPPKKPEKPAEKPREPERREEPPAALPYAAVGSPGLKGQVAVDAPDFEFTYYLVLVRNKIASNWAPPAGLAAGAPVRAVVMFRIGRGGEVAGIQLESTSGIEFFDRTAVRAVLLSDPLPVLPLGYTGADLGVHFGFEYAGP